MVGPGQVNIFFLGINFSYILLILDLLSDGMLSRLHDTPLREICDRFNDVCLVHAMCTETERASHSVSPSYLMSLFFPHLVYPIWSQGRSSSQAALLGIGCQFFCVQWMYRRLRTSWPSPAIPSD